MEPENVGDYNKQEYWDARYTNEAEFDWFTTVYAHSLEKVVELLKVQCAHRRASVGATEASASSSSPSPPKPIRVLHLGCGNSRLCADIAARWTSTPGLGVPPVDGVAPSSNLELDQIALDYSPVVIERMAAATSGITPPIQWIVGDVRTLANVHEASVDLVIDKGTMDALQADKDNDNMDDDIEAMLHQVSRVMRKKEGNATSAFVQFTWEIPYYRLHHTKREEYAWGKQTSDGEVAAISHGFLGESDLYRWFVYNAQQ